MNAQLQFYHYKNNEKWPIMLFAFEIMSLSFKIKLMIGNDQTTTRLRSGSDGRHLNNENEIQTKQFQFVEITIDPIIAKSLLLSLARLRIVRITFCGARCVFHQ